MDLQSTKCSDTKNETNPKRTFDFKVPSPGVCCMCTILCAICVFVPSTFWAQVKTPFG